MKVAPIIHTRTLKNDFLPGFLVRPDFFTSEDIDWARKYIRAATADIDSMQGERYLVADNGKIKLAGIVAIIEKLAQKANLDIDESYFFDRTHRNIYAFIGICVKKSGTPLHISLDYDDFMQLFQRYVIPVWEKEVLATQSIKAEFDVKSGNISNKPAGNEVLLNQVTIFESNPITDKNYFHYYLNSTASNFTFCSNISKYATLRNSIFSVLTTTSNNIKRLKMDASAMQRESQNQEENRYQEYKEKFRQQLYTDDEFLNGLFQNEESRKILLEKLLSEPQMIDKIIKDERLVDFFIEELLVNESLNSKKFEVKLKLLDGILFKGKVFSFIRNEGE